MEKQENSDQSTKDQITPKVADSSNLETEIETLKKALEEQKTKYLYLYAELENQKKRGSKEKLELIQFGNENIMRELLQVTDNLERAVQHTQNLESLVGGIQMVEQQLKDILTKFGVTAMKTVGEKFDPSLHEAVAQEPTIEVMNEQLILREHQKGYCLHGRLLRPARVTVAIKKE